MVYILPLASVSDSTLRIGTAAEIAGDIDGDWRQDAPPDPWFRERRVNRIIPREMVLELEGDEAEAADLRARFEHLRLDPGRIVFLPGEDLKAFLAEHATPYSGGADLALGLGYPKKDQRADRPVPTISGLAARLARRRG